MSEHTKAELMEILRRIERHKDRGMNGSAIQSLAALAHIHNELFEIWKPPYAD